MSIIEWFPLLSVNAQESWQVMQIQTSQNLNVSIKSLLSASVQSQFVITNGIMLSYLILSILIKRSSFLVAFFMSCTILELSFFDPLSEASLYLLTFTIYSYVILDKSLILKQRLACGILLILSLLLAYDAYFYGLGGLYGAHETVIYNNIEHLALCGHILFICSFIPFARIRDDILSFIDSISYVARHSAYLVIC